jgi:hypothetical protein
VVDAPAQIMDDDALIFTDGEVLTMTVTLPIAEQPLAFVPVTVYEAVAPGLTVILADVAPVLQT